MSHRITMPAQGPVGELHVVVLVLAGDNEGVRQLAIEGVGITVVHGVANSVVVIVGSLADDGFVVVLQKDCESIC